jgi:hypothetical protein
MEAASLAADGMKFAKAAGKSSSCFRQWLDIAVQHLGISRRHGKLVSRDGAR